MKIKRPPLRYFGGKWLLAPWIISHFPSHEIYTEVYCGSASVLIRKQRSKGEVINDRFGSIVNLFQVLRDPIQASKLKNLLELTPFARDEFNKSQRLDLTQINDPIEHARVFIFRSFAGFGSGSGIGVHKTSFRPNLSKGNSIPAAQWRNYPKEIEAFCKRLQGVVIENRDAIHVLQQHDTCNTLHYVDPPYLMSTRYAGRKTYAHEMDDADHQKLAQVLGQLKGMVVLSSYESNLYNELYSGWYKSIKEHRADGQAKRTEVLWLNQNAVDRLSDNSLFGYGTQLA